MRHGRLGAGLILTATLLAAGCGGDTSSDAGGDEPTEESTATMLDTEPVGLRERCGARLPRQAPVERVVLDGPDDAELVSAVFESPGAGTVMVLLPQITGGLCGWATFATEAARAGVSSIALDLCGYGDSTCPDDDLRSDAAAQVTVAAEHVRASLGATRVVVVGASMGASQAVRAAAYGAPVDGWVDVSGPPQWDGDRLVDLADRLSSAKMEGMVIFARTDGEVDYTEAQTLARRTGATFVDGGAGHGWDLLATFEGRLTKVGRQLVSFAAG